MSRHRLLGSLTGVLFATSLAAAQAPPRPQPTCIQNVSLDRSGQSDELVTLVLRDGRIVEVLPADAAPPKGARLIDGQGLLCLPAFVDSYTNLGIAMPEPVKDRDLPVDVGADVRVDMRLANRKGIQPAFRAAEALAIEGKTSEAWRKAGFGLAQIAPGGELLAGTSCLATTREAAMRDLVVDPDVFACAAFRASGEGYPSTLMGFHAQLRQFFHDAARHAELQARYRDGRPGPRPAFDADLEAGTTILSGDATVLCEAQSHRDVERWVKLADEFGLEIAITGGRDAWRVADLLAERRIPVMLTLDWGKEVDDPDAKDEQEEEGQQEPPAEGEAAPEPEDSEQPEQPEQPEEAEEPEKVEPIDEDDAELVWEYTTPLEVRRDRRRRWEETRDGALRLHEAGVRFAFGTDEDKPAKLLERVRELVEAGLPADAALAALTTTPAELFGVAGRLGRVAPGYDATLTLWSADPLTEKKAKPVWIFVDGFPTEFDPPKEDAAEAGDPAEGVDVTGTWSLVTENEGETNDSLIVLEMAEDGSVTGVLNQENPMTRAEMEVDLVGSVTGNELKLNGTFTVGEYTVDFEYTLEVSGDTLSGEVSITVPSMPEPFTRPVEGERVPANR